MPNYAPNDDYSGQPGYTADLPYPTTPAEGVNTVGQVKQDTQNALDYAAKSSLAAASDMAAAIGDTLSSECNTCQGAAGQTVSEIAASLDSAAGTKVIQAASLLQEIATALGPSAPPLTLPSQSGTMPTASLPTATTGQTATSGPSSLPTSGPYPPGLITPIDSEPPVQPGPGAIVPVTPGIPAPAVVFPLPSPGQLTPFQVPVTPPQAWPNIAIPIVLTPGGPQLLIPLPPGVNLTIGPPGPPTPVFPQGTPTFVFPTSPVPVPAVPLPGQPGLVTVTPPAVSLPTQPGPIPSLFPPPQSITPSSPLTPTSGPVVPAFGPPPNVTTVIPPSSLGVPQLLPGPQQPTPPIQLSQSVSTVSSQTTGPTTVSNVNQQTTNVSNVNQQTTNQQTTSQQTTNVSNVQSSSISTPPSQIGQVVPTAPGISPTSPPPPANCCPTDCNLDNHTAWLYSECGEEHYRRVKQWYGQTGAVCFDADTIGSLAASVLSVVFANMQPESPEPLENILAGT